MWDLWTSSGCPRCFSGPGSRTGRASRTSGPTPPQSSSSTYRSIRPVGIHLQPWASLDVSVCPRWLVNNHLNMYVAVFLYILFEIVLHLFWTLENKEEKSLEWELWGLTYVWEAQSQSEPWGLRTHGINWSQVLSEWVREATWAQIGIYWIVTALHESTCYLGNV